MRRRATTRRLRRTLLAGVAVLAVGLVVLLELTGGLDRADLSPVEARFPVRGARPGRAGPPPRAALSTGGPPSQAPGARAAPDDVMVVGIDDTTFSELGQR